MDGELVTMNEDTGLRFKEAINVFQGPVSCLWVKEVCGWDEREANNGPNDPELVPKVLDAWQSSLYNAVVTDPVSGFCLSTICLKVSREAQTYPWRAMRLLFAFRVH